MTTRKSETGIKGFDEIASGGLPNGRVTVIEGGPGTGKTLFGWAFLANGAKDYGEKGLCVTFDQSEQEIEENLTAIGINIKELQEKELFLHVIDTTDYASEVTGDFNLQGLALLVEGFIRDHGIKRLVIDSIQSLFTAAHDWHILRREISKLFSTLKERGVTSLVISEKGGVEVDLDFLSDCNIHLDMRREEEISTRRLYVSKMRGSFHETNEFPFLISSSGVQVLPISSIRLNYDTPENRVSTGISGLDGMLENKGYFQGSSIMVTGTAGTGKTSLACWLSLSRCKEGQKSLFFSFEESESQLLRNMKSIGMNLGEHLDAGCLRFYTASSVQNTLEQHISHIMEYCIRERPSLVVFDPVSNFINIGSPYQVKGVLMRMIDFFKTNQITSVFTSLTNARTMEEATRTGISSLMDLWIDLEARRRGNDHQKMLRIVKARGIDCDTSEHRLSLGREGITVVEAADE